MEICIIGAYDGIGGAERRVKTLMTLLKKKGNNVTICTWWRDKTKPKRENVNGAEIYRFYCPRFRYLEPLIFSEMSGDAFQKIKKLKDVEVVDCHYLTNPSKISTKLVATVGSPKAFVKHCLRYGRMKDALAHAGRIRLTAKVAKKADFVVCRAKVAYNEILEYGVNKERISVIKAPVDTELFSPNAEISDILNEDDEIILCPGRAGKYQGAQKLKQKIGGKLVFVTNVPHNLMPKYYSAAKVTILPSFWDLMPLVAIESLACETPVVAFDVGGVSEVVKHNETGFLVKFNDWDSMSHYVNLLIEDAKLRKKLGKRGRKLILKNHSLNVFIDKYLSVYETVTS